MILLYDNVANNIQSTIDNDREAESLGYKLPLVPVDGALKRKVIPTSKISKKMSTRKELDQFQKDGIGSLATASASSGTAGVSGRQQVEPNTDYRVVVFGSAGVGKSSLVVRFVKGTFKDTYVPTIEDNYRQVISNNKVVFTLQITDTTGSHQFPAMQRLNIQKGHAFILVYSITSRQSLDELRAIYKDIVEIKGGAGLKNAPMMLVGNKCDESSSRDVPTSTGEKLAQDWGCAFMETSAKTNVNVKEAFQELLKLDSRNSQIFNDSKSSDKSASSSSLTKNSVNPKSNSNKSKSNPSGKRKCTIM